MNLRINSVKTQGGSIIIFFLRVFYIDTEAASTYASQGGAVVFQRMREAIAYLQQGLCLIAIASLTAFDCQAID